MDGYEVAHRIRAQPWRRQAGFDSHCVKPLDPQYLFTLLDSLPAPGNSGIAPAAY